MKIKEGQVIKNYNELCKLLEVKPTKGKGRNYHIQEFERYCTYRKEGHKFIVEEVFEEPLPKVDGRINNGGNNTKYEDLMDKIMINLLIDYDGYIEESFSGVMNMIDFFTKKYVSLNKAGYKTFSQINKLGVGVTKTYQQQLFNVVRKCLETSLNRLNRNGVVVYEKKILMRDTRFNQSLADAKMEKLIAKTEEEVYKEMDIKYSKRINPQINRQFKNKVARKLDIMTYWNVYCVELIDKKMDYVEEDKDELIQRLIKSVVEQVKKQKSKNEDGDVYHPYSFKKYEPQIDKLTRLIWSLPEDYVSEYQFEQILIGRVEDIENRYKEYEEIESMLEFDGGIPF